MLTLGFKSFICLQYLKTLHDLLKELKYTFTYNYEFQLNGLQIRNGKVHKYKKTAVHLVVCGLVN